MENDASNEVVASVPAEEQLKRIDANVLASESARTKSDLEKDVESTGKSGRGRQNRKRRISNSSAENLNEPTRSKRTCNIVAQAKKEAEMTLMKVEKKPKLELTPEELLTRKDGSLKFYREPKKMSNLKKILAGVFTAELNHKFTESHSITKGSSRNGTRKKPTSQSAQAALADKEVEVSEQFYPIYGCHVAQFTIADPESPNECLYLIATTGAKWILVYTCTESKPLKLTQLYSDPGDDLYYSLKFTQFDNIPYLVAAGKNGVVRVINVRDGEVDQTFNAAANVINDVKVHPKRPEIIALACKDMSVHVWNIKSQVQVAIFSSRGLEGHNDEILIVDFKEDGSKLLSSGMDHFIIIWDLIGPNGIEKELEMSYDCNIKNESRPKLPVWRNFVYLKCSNVHRNYVDCAKFYGDVIISQSCHNESSLSAWMQTKLSEDNAPMKTQVDVLFQYDLPPNRSWFMKFCFDPSKRLLAAGLDEGKVLIVDLHSSSDPTDLRICHLQGKSDRQGLVRELCFSPDGKFLISVCERGKVFKYRVRINPTASTNSKQQISSSNAETTKT